MFVLQLYRNIDHITEPENTLIKVTIKLYSYLSDLNLVILFYNAYFYPENNLLVLMFVYPSK